MTTFVVLEEKDVDRVLRILYKGSRPAGIRMLNCSCGRSASLDDGDIAWLGWQVLPHPVCPYCQQPSAYQGPARDRYMQMVEQLTGGRR